MGAERHYYWGFEDLSAFTGPEEEALARFREVRYQIDRKIKDWLMEQGSTVEYFT